MKSAGCLVVIATILSAQPSVGAEPLQAKKAPPAGTASSLQQPLPAGIFKLEPVSPKDLPSLPDGQLLLVSGRPVTVAMFRARMAEARQAEQARFEQTKARFLEAERARHFAVNAKNLSEIDRLRTAPRGKLTREQMSALIAEARQLVERYRSANEKDKVDIERRAEEIMHDLSTTSSSY
jgi:hypothetical protein